MTTFNSDSELSAYLDKYRSVRSPHTEEDMEQLDALSSTVDLPSFYTFDEPTSEYAAVVSKTDYGFIVDVTDENGEVIAGSPFTSLSEAYDTVNQDLQGNIVFSGDLKAAGVDSSFFITEGNRLLLTVTDSERIRNAKNSYLMFLFQTEEYYKNRNDFFTGFHWVQNHPAFWYVSRKDSHYWNTSYAGFLFELSRDSEGKISYMLEAGAAVPPERIMHYHDTRLDVYASSFEEAYVKLAALVDKFFHVDGSEREGVEYERSELEILLVERLAAAESQSEEEK